VSAVVATVHAGGEVDVNLAIVQFGATICSGTVGHCVP
jgi:hypothetical protein